MARNPGWVKPAVFGASLIPLAWLIWRIAADELGPDPAQELAIATGEWTLRFLLITLSLTPLRRISGQAEFARIRRMVGLYALFYAAIHFAVWMSLLLGFRWHAIGEELLERPYVSIGFLALLILIALGLTSPKAMVRRMGKHWKRLHRLIYLAAILGIIHLTWIARADLGEAVFYGSALAILLGYRLWRRFGRSGKQMARR